MSLARSSEQVVAARSGCKVGSLMLACRSRIRDLGCRFPKTRRHKHVGSKPSYSCSRASLSMLDSMHGWLAAVPFFLSSVCENIQHNDDNRLGEDYGIALTYRSIESIENYYE